MSSGISTRTPITKEHLNKFKLCLLGHYHKPQNIEHVYYDGSPIPLRRDEAGEEKRFLVIDSETLEVESVLTEGYRNVITIIVNNEEDLASLPAQLNNIDINNSLITIKNFCESKIEKDDIDSKIKVVNMYSKDARNRGIGLSMDTVDQLREYLILNHINKEEYNMYLDPILELLS